MSSPTLHYSFDKPAVGGEGSTWGAILNGSLDKIDLAMFNNQTAAIAGIAPIGSVSMFAGATAPTNWLLCDGSSLLRAGTYAALFAVIGTAFGSADSTHFNLPNLQQRFPFGADVGTGNPLGQAGGGFSYTLAVANLPAHAHAITDVNHNHTVTPVAHTHVDSGHGHGINDPQHSHTIPGSMGGGIGAVTPPTVLNSAGGAVPTTNPSSTNISIQTGAANIQPASATVSLAASKTGITTTQNAGSGTPLSIVPSYVAMNFIIRFA